MTRETLDDAVDRVAGEITAVERDPTFGARLRVRLDEPRMVNSGRVAAVAAATLAIGLAIAGGMSNHEDQSRRDAPAAPVATVPTGAPSAETEAPKSRSVVWPTGRNAAIARRANRPALDAASAVEMVNAPPGLAVADLQLDPLSVPPVVVPGLEIMELSVTGLGIAEEQ
jgi:hypothetical protein